MTSEGAYTVICSISNTGRWAGKEVVQLYIADVESSLARPKLELKAFEKVALRPGETKDVEFAMTKESLGYWNNTKSTWLAEEGVFRVHVGASSRDLRLEGPVKLDHTLLWR